MSGAIKHWIDHLGILNWGDALIDSLTSSDLTSVSRVADIYDLTVDQIALHCSGIKFASKCYGTLHSSKRLTLIKFLSGLNIPNLGTSTATDMVLHGAKDLDIILSLSVDDLEKIPNIGLKTAQSIFDHLAEQSESIRLLASKLEILDADNGRLSGKSFCVTGSTQMPRKFLHTTILNNGGIVKDSVTSGLSYLISNESSNSSKSLKARKYSVPVITESDFLKMVEGQNGIG
jgi:DNA ligase (NAD+)